jgi:hypothetical protein
MRNRNLWTVAVAVLLAAPGCKNFTAGGAGPAYVRDAMREYRFPKACELLWVDALKVISADGFGLVGSDRELAGQEKQGVITSFLNRGHSTTRDDDGVFEAVSDANGQGLRFLVTGKPAGADGCFVQFFGIQDDRANSTESRHRDYDKELQLLSSTRPTGRSDG